MRWIFVYVKDTFTQMFWTVHVQMYDGYTLRDALEYATVRTFGGDAFGIKEFISDTKPECFSDGFLQPGMI